MRSDKGFESVTGISRGFERAELLGRGSRILVDCIFRGPRYRLPEIDFDITKGRIDSLFPNLSIEDFVDAIRLRAMPSREKRLSLIKCIHAGDLRFLGDSDLNFDSAQVTWNQIPGFEPWPKEPSWKISFRNRTHLRGDVKRIWNLNKHAHWVLMAGCHAWGEAASCMDLLLNQWDVWLSENPVGVGINWASELEVAERAINWIVSLCLLRNHLYERQEIVDRILNGIASHGVFLSKRLTPWSYNHCIGECTALIMVSNLFKGNAFATTWKNVALTVLSSKVNSMVSVDGYYKEKSPSYSLLVAQYLALAALLLGTKMGQFVRERAGALTKTLRKMSNMVGELPNLGDKDDASIVEYRFTDEKSIWEHSLFQLALPDLREIESDSVKTSCHFKGFEITVLRAGSFEAAFNVDNVPISANVAPHVHDDVLQFCLWHDGKPIVIDSGTFSYSAGEQKRFWYRSASAHNRPCGPGLSASTQAGLFRWRSLLRGTNLGLRSYKTFSVAGAKTESGEIMRFVLLHPYFSLILDRMESKSPDFSKISTTLCLGKSALVRRQKASYLVSGNFGRATVSHSIIGGKGSGQYGWHSQAFSDQYGLEKAGNAISVSVEAKNIIWSVWFISVVTPFMYLSWQSDEVLHDDKNRCYVSDQTGKTHAKLTKQHDEIELEICEPEGSINVSLPSNN